MPLVGNSRGTRHSEPLEDDEDTAAFDISDFSAEKHSQPTSDGSRSPPTTHKQDNGLKSISKTWRPSRIKAPQPTKVVPETDPETDDMYVSDSEPQSAGFTSRSGFDPKRSKGGAIEDLSSDIEDHERRVSHIAQVLALLTDHPPSGSHPCTAFWWEEKNNTRYQQLEHGAL